MSKIRTGRKTGSDFFSPHEKSRRASWRIGFGDRGPAKAADAHSSPGSVLVVLFFVVVVMMTAATAGAAFFMAVLMLVFAAAGAFVLFVVVMLAAAATAFVMAVLVLVFAAARAFVLFVVVMMLAAAATAFVVAVLVLVFAAAATFVLVVVMMVVFAATAAFVLVVVMMVVFAAATAGVTVIVTAATAGVAVIVTAATATAAAAATARLSVTLDTDRIEFGFDFLHFKADHFEHLGDVGQSENGKTVFRLSNVDAAVDQSAGSFLHRAQIARHANDLFNGRTDNPESPLVVKENVAHEERTFFVDSHFNLAFGGFDAFGPGLALFGRQDELMSAIENGLGRLGFGSEKLGKSGHDESFMSAPGAESRVGAFSIKLFADCSRNKFESLEKTCVFLI